MVNFLRRKELLLILDNAEHLISQPLADFILEILKGAAAVKIIVTSRERLLMQAERVLDLPGLAYSPDETDIVGSPYPAGQLFRQRAANHGIELATSPEVDKSIYQLCRLVDGLPLALELAATWTTTLPIVKIAAEIEQGLSILTTTMRDVPFRQRSVQAVFDTSWQLLKDEAQRVLRQLAYFQGGFTAQAAQDITGASASQLQALVNKSLIRQQANGDYEIHELIRQYAADKLAQWPAKAAAVAQRHSDYFADFLAKREDGIKRTDYLQAKAEIQANLDNIRLAWDWAVSKRQTSHIERSYETLHYFFLNTNSLFTEAAERFQRAADQLAQNGKQENGLLVARLWARAAVNRRILGQLDAAEALLRRSLELFQRYEETADIARAYSTLSVIKGGQQDSVAARQLAEEAVALAREMDEPIDLSLTLNNLAYVLGNDGEYEAGIAVLKESIDLSQAVHYPHGTLSAMNMMGIYYASMDELERAKLILEALVDKCREAATPSRLAQALDNLGVTYKKLGEIKKARRCLQEATALYEEVGQVHYAGFAVVVLGETSVDENELEQARAYCQRALEIAQDLAMPALALNALALYGHLLRAREDYGLAASFFTFVQSHSATETETKINSRQTIQTLQSLLLPKDFSLAQTRGQTWSLEEATGQVLVD